MNGKKNKLKTVKVFISSLYLETGGILSVWDFSDTKGFGPFYFSMRFTLLLVMSRDVKFLGKYR